MAGAITKTQLINASIDADDLAIILNAPASYQSPDAALPPGYMRTRLGLVVRVLAKALQDIVVSGTLDDAVANAIVAYVNQLFMGINITDVNGLHGTDGFDYVFATVDAHDRFLFGVTPHGDFVTNGESFSQVTDPSKIANIIYAITDADDRGVLTICSDGSVAFGGARTTPANAANTGGIIEAFVDKNDRAYMYVDEDGTVHIPKLDGREDPSAVEEISNYPTDIMHIMSYGQSLSVGSRGNPSISTTQPYSNLTFVSGIFPRPPQSDYTASKPLIEQDFVDDATGGTIGETPISGWCNGYVERAVADGGTAGANVFFGTAPGFGGRSINALTKGTIPYGVMMGQASAALSLSASANKSYSVWGIGWTQGEEDVALGTSAETYYNALNQLVKYIGDDVKAITGQSFSPPVVMYQTASHRRPAGSNHFYVARAQWLAARDNPMLIQACPIYHLQPYTDGLHLTNKSYLQLGKLYGRAFYETIKTGKKWAPVSPLHVTWQGRVIDIIFNVPTGNLVFDTTLVSAAPNMGFDIWTEDSEVANAISSVTITAKDRIKIVLNIDPQSNHSLTYAQGRVDDPRTTGPMAGPRGNLRDTAGDGDYYLDTDGATVIRLHNWSVMWQYDYSKGDF